MLYHLAPGCVLAVAEDTRESILLLIEELALEVSAEDVPGHILVAPVRGFADLADQLLSPQARVLEESLNGFIQRYFLLIYRFFYAPIQNTYLET